jgi:hypothetical protein
MRRMALLILMLGLVVLWQPVEASQVTLVYSNDTLGYIDPCSS